MDEKKEEEEEKLWKSCCFQLDPVPAKYFVNVFILFALIILSGVMLVHDKDCNSQRNWSSLLTLCLGVFLPGPRLK